jgi:hypothetical protein
MKVIIINGALFGLVWSFIFLIFALMHNMPVMFNDEFIFLIANIFNIKVDTTLGGFILSFIDGAVIGIITGILFIKIKKNFY